MDQATEIILSEPLVGKVSAMVRDICAQICADTGISPSYAKVGIQMPDDSVFEARLGLCPDGCGQVTVTPAVLPRL